MKKKETMILTGIIVALAVIAIGGSFAYFMATIGGTGNNSNNTSSATAVSLGEIKYDGDLVFNGTSIYPGYKDIQVFTIGPDARNGTGIYEIDLAATVPTVFGSDIEVTLYKTTDATNNHVTRTEGTLTQVGEQYTKEDTINITGTPEKVYQGVLKEDTQKILEQSDFTVPGLSNTTYYLVYNYKNNGNQNAQQGSTFSGKVTVRYIIEKSSYCEINPTTGACSLLNNGETTKLKFDNTVDNNLRYIGANPNNYVSFNNELWRIIGVMNNIDDGTGKKESRLKIIRSTVENKAWDTANANDWSKSSLQKELNETYYNGLTVESKNMIENTLWGLGGKENYTTSYNGLASHWYGYERGDLVFTGRPTSWIGRIGLMYPSDYGYATAGSSTTNRTTCLNKLLNDWHDSTVWDCKTNDWLFRTGQRQWTLTPYSDNSSTVFMVNDIGNVSRSNASNAFGVSPALYLTSKVSIGGGIGSSTDPYTLTLS